MDKTCYNCKNCEVCWLEKSIHNFITENAHNTACFGIPMQIKEAICDAIAPVCYKFIVK